MDYIELAASGASSTEKREYLVDGETTAITIRIPQNLKDAAAKDASLQGLSFSAYVRTCLLNELLKIND